MAGRGGMAAEGGQEAWKGSELTLRIRWESHGQTASLHPETAHLANIYLKGISKAGFFLNKLLSLRVIFLCLLLES